VFSNFKNYLPLIILIRKPIINTITTTAIIAAQNPASNIPMIASQLVRNMAEDTNKNKKVKLFLFIVIKLMFKNKLSYKKYTKF
jgi:hypothetical protein